MGEINIYIRNYQLCELVNCRIPGCLMSIKHVHRRLQWVPWEMGCVSGYGAALAVGPIWSNVWVTSISSPFIWIRRVVCFCMFLCCFVFFRIFCVVVQPGAAFLAIWCILKLKSLICVLFAAFLELRFWLLAFGFGFTWLLVFGFWVLVSLLLCFGIVVCSKHITFHIIIAYKLHVNCTEGTNKFYSMWVSVHAVVRGIETCFQQVSNYFLFLKFLKPYFKTLVELCFLTMFVWFVFHNGCVAVRSLPLNLYACLCERNYNIFQHQVS